MTGRDDMDDLADLWNAAPPREDQDEVVRLAQQIPARARLVQYGELALVILLGIAILGAMAWRLVPATAATGGAVLAVLGWSAWQRHRLRDLALLIEEGDRLTLVRSHIRAKQAELARSRLGLLLFLPAWAAAVLMGLSLVQGPRVADILGAVPAMLAEPRNLAIGAILVAAFALMTRVHARLGRELQSLRVLEEAYRAEAAEDVGQARPD